MCRLLRSGRGQSLTAAPVSISRRTLLAGSGAVVATGLAGVRVGRAEDIPGVTATEIKIGSTTSLSGPVSALGVQARTLELWVPARIQPDKGPASTPESGFALMNMATIPARRCCGYQNVK